jgi:hypothetical protein
MKSASNAALYFEIDKVSQVTSVDMMKAHLQMVWFHAICKTG